MINGTVVGLQARIRVVIRSPRYSDVELDCVVDTGFEGALTLPPTVVRELGLPYVTDINANLANNSDILANVHLATILWMGVERNVAVLAMGRRPLIGTALLEDYHLGIDFCQGGSVIVDEML
jgi:clan AA aspartic protease